MLFGFAAGGEPAVASVQAVLGVPGAINDISRGAALPVTQGVAKKRVMPVVPGGCDQDAAEMRIAGFGDVAAGAGGAAGVLRGDEAGEGHDPGGGGEAARIAKFGGDGERGQIVDAAEAAQALDARPQRVDGEEVAQLRIDGLESCDAFIDGAYIGAVGLLERRQRPALGL